MREITLRLTIAAISFVIGIGSAALYGYCGANYAERSEIIELTRAYHDAMAANDRHVLESILADRVQLDRRFVRSEMSRNEFIDGIRPYVAVESMSCSDVSVTVSGDTAIYDGVMYLIVRMDNNKQIDHEARYTYGYQRIDGEWRMISLKQK